VTEYNVEEIIEGIRQNDVVRLDYVYKKFYPQIKFFVTSNSGDEDDAQDIFQEAIVIIFNKLKQNQLQISCTFKTYLYSVCRLLWLKQLEKRKIKNELSIEKNDYIELTDKTEELGDRTERFGLYQEYFKKLSEDCRKVLEMSLEKIPYKKIAVIMGYKSDKYAKKRKYQCKEKLINSIKSDPKFKELL
tara:strand:+ start:295 stop:861 length:567 start_codon:yes stop_codon:yes gene_type:complete